MLLGLGPLCRTSAPLQLSVRATTEAAAAGKAARQHQARPTTTASYLPLHPLYLDIRPYLGHTTLPRTYDSTKETPQLILKARKSIRLKNSHLTDTQVRQDRLMTGPVERCYDADE